MFGISYKTKCPCCGKIYEANHGGTSFYKIKGQEELGEYIEEWCPHCDKPYLRLNCDSNIILMRELGKTLNEAIECKISMVESHRQKACLRHYNLPFETIEKIKRECSFIYEIDLNKLYAYYDINKEDLIPSGVVFY